MKQDGNIKPSEYLQLHEDLRQAKKAGDEALCQRLQARVREIDDMMWQSVVAVFTELLPYRTVVEALEKTAARLGVPFPDLTDERYRSGDGQFIFGVSDGIRTVQIFPLESFGYYSIEVFEYAIEGYEERVCYRGHTTSLEEATLVLSRWFVERCSIEALHAQFSWMSDRPLRLL